MTGISLREFAPWNSSRAKEGALANLPIACLPSHTSSSCRTFMEIWATDVLHCRYKKVLLN